MLEYFDANGHFPIVHEIIVQPGNITYPMIELSHDFSGTVEFVTNMPAYWSSFEIVFSDNNSDFITETWGVSTENNELEIPNYNLQNYPNPFNSQTTISFNLTTESTENTEIIIYNIKGQKIDQLEITNYELGMNQIIYSADKLSSGIYFYKLMVDDKIIATKKMILIK